MKTKRRRTRPEPHSKVSQQIQKTYTINEGVLDLMNQLCQVLRVKGHSALIEHLARSEYERRVGPMPLPENLQTKPKTTNPGANVAQALKTYEQHNSESH